MKNRTIARIKITCILMAILVCIIVVFCAPTPINELREPSQGYKTLEEEYVAAVEYYLASDGNVIIPEGAEFSSDGEKIKIKDKKSNAYLECYMILDDSVPVYNWNYEKYNYNIWFLIVFLKAIGTFLVAYIVSNIICFIYTLCYKARIKSMNKKKLCASYGDERIHTSCQTCVNKFNCKCIKCMYIGKCGHCPGSDCIEAFEEHMYEVKQKAEIAVTTANNTTIPDESDDSTPSHEEETGEVPEKKKGLLQKLFRKKSSENKDNDLVDEPEESTNPPE